jgi:hypothetical protein
MWTEQIFLEHFRARVKVNQHLIFILTEDNSMKIGHIFSTLTGALLVLATTTGCRSDYGAGNPYQPGPTAGKAVGAGVGTVAGNVVGAGVGVVQGTTHGFANSFDPQYHMVRYWKTETTTDGRTIQVPYDVLVDQYGRPAMMPAPTGNPAPPPMVPATNTPPMTSTNAAGQ